MTVTATAAAARIAASEARADMGTWEVTVTDEQGVSWVRTYVGVTGHEAVRDLAAWLLENEGSEVVAVDSRRLA